MLKRVVKWLARPLTRRLFARVDARIALVRDEAQLARQELAPLRDDLAAILKHLGPIAARVQTHDHLTEAHAAAVAELREQVGALNDHLPILLNTISSQNAAAREARRAELELRDAIAALDSRLADDTAHLHKRLDEIGERIAQVEERGEFMRREVLFELRHGGSNKGLSDVPEPRVLAPDKVAEAGDDIRLNLGCGHIPIDGLLNVDGRPLDGVDIVAEVGDLPFEPGTVAAIHSAHLLEHFPLEELRRRLLPYWLEVLRPGGSFTAVVPDSETMLEEYSAGRLSFEDLRLVTFGEQEYDGDFHFNMFTKASLCDLLSDAGFTDVQVVESARRNGVCYEMEIAARRPAGDG